MESTTLNEIDVTLYTCDDRKFGYPLGRRSSFYIAVDDFRKSDKEYKFYFAGDHITEGEIDDRDDYYNSSGQTISFILSWLSKEKGNVVCRGTDGNCCVFIIHAKDSDPDEPFPDAPFAGSIELADDGIYHYYEIEEEDGTTKPFDRRKIGDRTYSLERITKVD